MNDKFKALLNIALSASLLVALAIGIFCLFGYSWWDGFYASFGIPLKIIEISKEELLLYGAPWVLCPFLFITGFLLLIYWSYKLPKTSWLKKISEKLYQLNRWLKKQLSKSNCIEKVLGKLSPFAQKLKNKLNWLLKCLDKLRLLIQWLLKQSYNLLIFYWIFLLAALLIFISLFFGHIILKPITEHGKETGTNYALCNAPLVEVVYKDETAKVKKEHWELLTISKGTYFFFETVNKAEETPKVIILQKESLFSIKTIEKIKTETKIKDCNPPQTTNKTKPCC